MKAIGLLCALAALVACSESESPADSETGKASAAQAGWALEPGTYDYARADGGAGLLVLAEDGTYSNAMSGGDLETGTWGHDEGLSCLVPADGAARQCYRFAAPDARGRFTGTAGDGSVMRARKLD